MTASLKEALPQKTLLEQILEWSEGSLAKWQRDALRRLFQRTTDDLSEQDLDELFTLMKLENGVAGGQELVAKPWAKEHLPGTSGNSSHVVLLAMRELKFVNRIVPDQSLAFAKDGLTIVYGGNGSGKSGYSRVLKRACRARDQSEPVHPDATDSANVGRVPEAIFDVEIGGKNATVAWALDKPAPDELSAIAVFDARCARAYLTTEGDVAYIPYGLDVVADLANRVLPQIEKKLVAEMSSLDTDLSVLVGLQGDTEVGRLVSKFGPKTDAEEIRRLGTVTEIEETALTELDKTLGEEDPLAASKKVRLEAQRLTNLRQRIGAVCKTIDDTCVDALKQLVSNRIAAEKAVELAARDLRAGEDLLSDTGGDAWRRLFEAAGRFSVEHAYHGREFPLTDEGAVCVLCQQPLGDAAERMKRFATYLQQDTAKNSQEAKRSASDAVENVRRADLRFGLDAALSAELLALDDSLPEAVAGYEKAVEERRQAILRSAEQNDWSGVSGLSDAVLSELEKHATVLTAKADVLEQAGDAEKRRELTAKRNELKARATLKASLKVVEKLLSNIQRQAALEACKKDLKTAGISTKAKALAEGAVTTTLREALDREFEKLGGVPFELKLADRSDKGKTKYKLQMATAAGAKLEEILSEGEQRAIAIGSFLGELELAGHKGGVVFDDPVSSLDHQRKSLIARRLAEEAKERQVIVFTHDLVFLTLLQGEADDLAAPQRAHWLSKDDRGLAGSVKLDDSPASTRSYRTTQLARASIKSAGTLAGEEQVRALRQAAGQLRRTLEEIVPFHLLKEVVMRWRENLMLTKLKQVHWDNAIADEIDSLFADLSRHMEGHSHTEEYTGGVPTLKDLGDLADRVDKVIAAAKKPRS